MWDVQIKLGEKVGLCVLMGLGVLTAACAVVRTVLLEGISGADITCMSFGGDYCAMIQAIANAGSRRLCYTGDMGRVRTIASFYLLHYMPY